MTAAEKAIWLVETYYNVWAFNNTFTNFKDAQTKKTKAFKMSVRSALIAVDEIEKTLCGVWADIAARISRSCQDTLLHQAYCKKVKEEILKLNT